jgi:ERCC4-type nuclease
MFEIVVDVREHALIEKLRSIADSIQDPKITITTAALLLGDVLFKMDDTRELILFERKSFTDLLASIKDGRYDEQSHRLIHTSGLHPHNIVYVLEGVFSTLRSPADKKIILSAMTSLSYFKGFSVFRTATVLETAEFIWAMANKMQKEFDKGKQPAYASNTIQTTATPVQEEPDEHPHREDNSAAAASISYGNFVKKAKRDNITPENIGEILLSQIPGISSHIAVEILKHFGGSFTQLIQEIKTAPEKLDAIYLESSKGDGKRRKLSSAVIQSILRYLREEQGNDQQGNNQQRTTDT